MYFSQWDYPTKGAPVTSKLFKWRTDLKGRNLYARDCEIGVFNFASTDYFVYVKTLAVLKFCRFDLL